MKTHSLFKQKKHVKGFLNVLSVMTVLTLCIVFKGYAQSNSVINPIMDRLDDDAYLHNIDFNNKNTSIAGNSLDNKAITSVNNVIVADNKSINDVKIIENAPQDRLHPEYGKIKLDNKENSEELMSMRTRNSRTFKNADGTFTTQQSYGAMHYRKNGLWLSIENNLEAESVLNGVYSLNKTDLPIFVNAKTGQTKMQLAATGESIVFGTNAEMQYIDAQGKPVNKFIAKIPVEHSKSGNVITLNNLWDKVNRRQTVDFWRVKTDYIITEKPDITGLEGGNIVFTEYVELPKGWTIKEGEGSQTQLGWKGELLIIDNKGKQKGKFELPLYYDSYKPAEKDNENNHAIEGAYTYKLNGNIVELSTIVPVDWLLDSQRVFPVTIDPSVSNTYTAGDISTDFGFQTLGSSSTCPGTLTVAIPVNSMIVSTDVAYNMTAVGLGWMSEQRSQLRCTSPGGINESVIYAGVGNSTGTYNYNRAGLEIANGVSGGGNITFQLHAGRTYGGTGCNTTYNYVNNNTWIVTVNYILPPARTLYSYQNGNWEDANTWTTDPSGTLSVSPAVPGVGDKAVILNGRTVTATTNNKTVDIVEIQDGAILNLGATTGHTFSLLQGTGRLRTSATTLPAGSMAIFVASTGGTIEYYGAGSFTFDRNTFNNLILNFSNASAVASVGADFTVNGDLTITSGDFRIGNNATARTVSVYKNVTVGSAGKVSVHTLGAHYFDLYGDLTVNTGGSFKLHNLASPSYATAITDGKADLRCLHATANQTILAHGPIEPYWIIENKGIDQTYMVDVQASGDYFKLFGHTNGTPGFLTYGNLQIYNGTLKLGANIIIPQIAHSEGWMLPATSHLWINGANVTVTNFPTYTRSDGFYLYGKLTVSAGSLDDNSEIGIILRETGVVQVDGGSLSTSVIRPSVIAGIHRGTYIQNGGTVTVKRDIETSRANTFNMYASLCLPYPDNVFNMTGGTLNILNSTITGNVGAEFSLLLSANLSNINMSGGEINITVPTNRNAKILSKGSFYNLNIISTSSTYRAFLDSYAGYASASIPAATIQSLVVKNNFSISSPARFDAVNQNVTVGGNFTLASGATYIPGTNTTIFNGTAGQQFANAGTITSGLYNLELANTSILNITNALTVRNNFTSAAQTIFRDMGNLVNIAGNIVHQGLHESQLNGAITLNGTGAQTISGNGQFGNLNLNKASGSTTALANLTINGNLRLANTAAILNMGAYRLSLSASSNIYDNLVINTTTAFSATRMIQTNGSMSDGGVKFAYAAVGSKLYPIGVSGKYTKAEITFNSAPTQWGSITIRPVNNFHPLRTSNNALTYYWRVSSSDFTGITSGMLEQRFYYVDADINGTEANYVPGVYNPVAWSYTTTDKVSDLINEILFDNITSPNGDFTAGYPDAFGTVNAYYSWSNGQWTVPATWSTSKTVYTPPATAPTATSAVVIQGGHTVTVNANNQTAGYLIIEENATLDLGTTTGHNFGALDNGQVSGNGLLRISSATAIAQFPAGDFGEFLGENGGTVEYYTTGAQNFTIPPSYIGNLLSENFNGASIPSSWTVVDDGVGATWGIINTGIGSTNCANITVFNGGDLLVTPRIIPTVGNTTLSYYANRNNNNARIEVWVSTTGNSYNDFIVSGTCIRSSTQPPNNWTTQWTENLSAWIGQPIYVAFRSVGNNNGYRIDNVAGPSLYNIPNKIISNYNHLIVNPSNSRIIDFPQTDITVHGNLEVKGAGTVRLNPDFSKTVEVKGNLDVNQTATLQYPNNAAQTLIVKGNLSLSNGTALLVATTGTAVNNILNVYGNITNNGTFNLFDGTRYADLYFLGTTDQILSGGGATTNFNKVFVNKGSSQTPTVHVTSTNFTINTSAAQTLSINNGTIRFNGPTSTISGNFAFNIPETGCLAVAGGTITVGGAVDAADIILAGKINVSGGTLNIGNGSVNNNDIEIAGAGAPTIEVSGGTLVVNGQIRRSTTSEAGALRFTQSGGNITIHGRNRIVNRALLEVLNTGSQFNVSGNGNIYIVNGGGNTWPGDLYLNASSYTVEGGTITLGTGATSSATFYIYLGNPIWSLTIDGTTNAKTAILRSFPANIYGDLRISTEAQVSVFNVATLSVNVGGDFINLSTDATNPYVASTGQITTFIGKKATQALTNNGALLRFRNFVVNHSSASGVVTFSGTQQIVINEDLKIDNGIFEVNDRAVTLLGNFYNNKTYRSLLNGYITFGNSAVDQNIYGTDGATFGSFRTTANRKVNAFINMNVVGAYIVLANNSILNIGDKNIRFSSNTSFGAFTGTNYIITNGALSDGGVTRIWSGTGSFTFPIGVAGKYTPVTINVTNLGGGPAGNITIKPVNSYHPAVQTGFGNDELQYYWNVTSQGFGASPTVTHTYTYLDVDVRGTETDYVGGRFFNYLWVPDNGIAGAVNSTNNTITLTGVNYINGEYTAGAAPNFVSKPILYSRVASGNWENANSWSTSPSGTPIASAAPNGNPVVIQAGHTITVTANGAYAYSASIASNAVLALGSTREHNFGHVSGSGTIKMSATASGSFIFPGGFYDDFMNTAGSTIEYEGTGTLPSSITTYQNVVYSGVGSTKYIPAINYTVLGNLEIRQGFLDNTNYNRNIIVYGNWVNNVVGGFKSGLGMVTFSGLNSQLTANGGETFFHLRINRTNGNLTLNSPVTVNRYLYLTDGKIITTNTNILTLSWTSSGAVSGGSANSFVDGPLRKNISSGDAFYFPVGDANRYASTRVFTTSMAGYWIVEYFNQAPANPTNLAVPLKAVSTNEYWTITGPASSTAKVLLRWDAASNPIPATPSGRQQLRVAQYLSSNWTGLSSQITDGGTTGTVQTTVNASTNGAQLFTIGLNNVATARIIGYDTAICNDGSTMPVVVEFTGASPWNLTYTINGANATTLNNIGSNPYPIIFQYADLFAISGAGSYKIKLSSVYSGTSEGYVIPDSAILTLKVTPAPVITGNDRVIINSTESYYVQLAPNELYAWSVSGGTISGASNNRTVTINWGAVTGPGWVEVLVTNTVTGCTKTERLNVIIRDWPVITGYLSVCSNGSYTYSSNSIAGHTYLWSVVGGSIVGVNNASSVNVIWGTEAAGSITVEQSDGVVTLSDSRNVTINNSGNNLWNGSQDSLWTNGNNWNCNCAPAASMNVTINSGTTNIPVITGTTAAQVSNLNLQTGATLKLRNTASLIIANTMQLNGLIFAFDNSYVQLGTDAGNLGTLNYSGGRIIGLFKRWVNGSGSDIDFPLGTTEHNRWVRMRYTAAPTAGILNANYVTSGLESIFTTGDLYGNMPFSEDTLLIDNISQRGLWMVEPNAVSGVSGGTYDIKFYTHGIAEIQIPEGLRMIKRSVSSGNWVIPGTHGGVELIDAPSYSYWVSRTGVTTFSYYALAGKISENPLPITLTSFTGKWNNGKVLLNWITQSEINNDYFIIERSRDMKSFTEIGRIKGKIHSNSTTSYSLFDENVNDVGYYYKLKQVDIDGTTTELSTVFVKIPMLEDDLLKVYPQPAKDLLNVEIKVAYNSTMYLEIHNSLGTRVWNAKYDLEKGVQLMQINTGEFVPGYYVLIVSDGENTYRKQIILGLK